MTKKMTVAELKLLLAQYNLEFEKKLAACHPDAIHIGITHDKDYNSHMKVYTYQCKRPRIKITYRQAWRENLTGVLTVSHVSTQTGLQSFYGYTTEYGHNVYMTADDKFFARIISIEKL